MTPGTLKYLISGISGLFRLGSFMLKNNKIVAIIPARGGSKSIPRKNIKLLNGYPLIAFSIKAGCCSKYIDRIIVSTDDQEIAAIAQQWGAEVPFIRPAELAEDYTEDLSVFQHAINWLEENENYRPDVVVQLRPTSPFRPKHCIDGAIETLFNNSADSVRGVTQSSQNPFKMWRIDAGKLVPLLQTKFKEPYNMPRQQLPSTYWQTGHIEVIRYETIMHKHSMTGDLILPYIIDTKYSIDLDTEQQWQFAEFVLNYFDLDMFFPAKFYYLNQNLEFSCCSDNIEIEKSI